MNQKQSIFNLLAKKPATKISSKRRVNMSRVDDLDIAVTRLGVAITENNRGVSALIAAAENVANTALDVQLMYEQVESAGEEVLSSANELGIDPYSIPALGKYLQYRNGDDVESAKEWEQEASRLL